MKYKTIELEGTQFYLNVHRQELVQLNNEDNRIKIDDLIDHGTHYSMLYHPETKNWPMQLDPPIDSRKINILRMVDIDPMGMAAIYGHDEATIKSKSDIEVITPNWNEVLDRINGKLPIIEIVGDRYIIDIANKEFRYENDQNIKIPFQELLQDVFEPESHCYYDFNNKKIIDLAPWCHPPAGVVYVDFPSNYEMDPIGMARQDRKADEAYLRQYPYCNHQIAKITGANEDLENKLGNDFGKKGKTKLTKQKAKRRNQL